MTKGGPTNPNTDTICAIATPPGAGGIGVVRVSGPAVQNIARAVLGELPRPRFAAFAKFLDEEGASIDSGIALYFPGPHSFTGEDVLEFQGHGGPVILQLLMRRILDLGARPAGAGEFSQRAFLNDKLDLAQAEAIADLIASGTEAAARAAQHSLEGVFSRLVAEVQTQLTGLRVFVEAAIDFPEEEIDFLADSDVLQRLAAARQEVDRLLEQASQGRLLRDGIVMAIIGRPNAGKSSLLNALSGYESAIVTEIPGTTRDVLRERLDLGGIPVHVADTAGIRDTDDRIEAEGVRRARQTLESSDIVLLVVDVSQDREEQGALLNELPRHVHPIRVYNKIDLLEEGPPAESAADEAWISAVSGAGMDDLKAKIRASVGAADQSMGEFSARQRHVDALKRVRDHLDSGQQQMERSAAAEILAEELRLAQRALGEITGELLPDDLLGEIFASFCIGK
jgi:tRNA modification GTPase